MSGPEPDFPGHLMFLKNKGDRLVRAVLTSMVRVDTKKGGRSAAISHVRQLINHANDERDVLKDLERKLASTRRDVEKQVAHLESSRTALSTAKKRRAAADGWSRGLPSRSYKLLLLALTVAELPLLALAFQNFFSVGFSIIVSIGVSVAIIFCAHVAGVLLQKRESVLLPGDTRILVSIWTGVIATIVGLSFVRELYLESNNAGEGVATGPTWIVVIVFAVFNILVFGAAVLLSKFRHSELAEDVDEATREVKSVQRQIRRGRRREERSRKHVTRSEDRIVLLDGLAASTAQRARTSVDQAKLAASRHKDFIEKCYSLYIRENVRAQASRTARRAGLRQPLDSDPLPSFTECPLIKDPKVEFRPFEQRVSDDLRPLEKLLTHFEPTPRVAAQASANDGKARAATRSDVVRLHGS